MEVSSAVMNESAATGISAYEKSSKISVGASAPATMGSMPTALAPGMATATTPPYGSVGGNMRALPLSATQLPASSAGTAANMLPNWTGAGNSSTTAYKTVSSNAYMSSAGSAPSGYLPIGNSNFMNGTSGGTTPLSASRPSAFGAYGSTTATSNRSVMTNSQTMAAMAGGMSKGFRPLGQGSAARPLTNNMMGAPTSSALSGNLSTTAQFGTAGGLAPPYGMTSMYGTPNHLSGGATSTMQGSMTRTAGTTGAITAGQTTTTNRTVTGQQSVVGTNTWVDESRVHIVSERVTEHEVRVPKRVVREEIIEKVIVVPEKLVREEVVEEVVRIRQKIIELAKPIIQETIIEVPEIEYIERIVEVPEVIIQEKIKEVPRVEIQERIIEIPKIIQQEKVVEVPEIEYVDVPYEKIIEVPEVREQVVLRQIPVPQYVDKPVPEYIDTEIIQDVTRTVPVPVEAIITLELHLPKICPRYRKVDVPLYVPRFIEIAVPCEMMDEQMVAQAEAYARQVAFLASQSAASLCELENLGGTLKNMDIATLMSAFKSTQEMTNFFEYCWTGGRFPVAMNHVVTGSATTTTATTVTTSTVIGGKAAAAASGQIAGGSTIMGQLGRPLAGAVLREGRSLGSVNMSSKLIAATSTSGTSEGQTLADQPTTASTASPDTVPGDTAVEINAKSEHPEDIEAHASKMFGADIQQSEETKEPMDGEIAASTSILSDIQVARSSIEHPIQEEEGEEIVEHSEVNEGDSDRGQSEGRNKGEGSHE